MRSVLLLVALATASVACGEDAAHEVAPFNDTTWPSDRGFIVQMDNDLFSGAHRDKDYSWGFAVTFASPTARLLMTPVDRVRGSLESLFSRGSGDSGAWLSQSGAAQVGLLAFTPRTLKSREALPNDRPFASLLYVSSGHMRVLDEGDRARYTNFTVGALGLGAAPELHRQIHKVVGDEVPYGWNHQISDGGEPTARYVQAEQWLLGGGRAVSPDMPEMKLTLAGSAGYMTESSVAFSGRWGRIQTPWWSFNPELTDYTAAPIAPVSTFGGHGVSELYFFAGGRLKARAYNALLQGQFRSSDVRVAGSDLAHTQAEGWLGVASTISDLRFIYTLRYTSREMTTEPGARGLIWAGINIEKVF